MSGGSVALNVRPPVAVLDFHGLSPGSWNRPVLHLERFVVIAELSLP